MKRVSYLMRHGPFLSVFALASGSTCGSYCKSCIKGFPRADAEREKRRGESGRADNGRRALRHLQLCYDSVRSWDDLRPDVKVNFFLMGRFASVYLAVIMLCCLSDARP